MSPIYCGAASAALWYFVPYEEDGSGPMPTFCCSGCPAPSLEEFQTNYWVIWPFCVAALLLPGLGCGMAPQLARSWWRVGLWHGSQIFDWDLWVIGKELETSGLIAALTAAFAWVRPGRNGSISEF